VVGVDKVDSLLVRKERKANAGPSTPLKCASLRMTDFWLGKNEKQMGF